MWYWRECIKWKKDGKESLRSYAKSFGTNSKNLFPLFKLQEITSTLPNPEICWGNNKERFHKRPESSWQSACHCYYVSKVAGNRIFLIGLVENLKRRWSNFNASVFIWHKSLSARCTSSQKNYDLTSATTRSRICERKELKGKK